MKSFEAKHIRKRFEGVVALRYANFKMEGAKICGLVGANGSGKTTFARICAGLVKADGGEEIFINGKKVRIHSPLDAEKFGIVLVHQNLSLIPDLSVWENINLGHEERSKNIFLDNKHAKDLAVKVLRDLSLDKISLNDKVASLSLGEKQIVEIAKAISQEAKILVMDEPTAALSEEETQSLFKIIKTLKSKGVAIIYSEDFKGIARWNLCSFFNNEMSKSYKNKQVFTNPKRIEVVVNE